MVAVAAAVALTVAGGVHSAYAAGGPAAEGQAANGKAALVTDPASLVNTKIMTGNSGNDFPGAQAPFGMIQWSPNMQNRSAGGNYDNSSTSLRGYALTNLAGPGCDAMGDDPIMPLVGAAPTNVAGTMVSYDHASEIANAGYFSAKSSGGQVRTELTATTRSGMARITYPASTQAAILVKLRDTPTIRAADPSSGKIVSDTEISGTTTSGHFCGDVATYTVHFDVVFDHPFTTSKVIGSDGIYVSFDTTANQVVQAKVGISFVSDANAKANWQAENPNWDFDAIKNATHTAFNDHLSRIDIAGGTADQQKLFYTSLYHVLNHPNVVSDANGQYLGYDKAVHTTIAGQSAHYENFSGWDIYHNEASLAALVAPRETGEMSTSLMQAYEQAGAIPQWGFMNSFNGVMIGDSAPAIAAEYHAFGARGANDQTLLADLVKQATTNNRVRGNSTTYDSLGYTANDPSLTIEWTQQDFALSRLAYALGDTAHGDLLTKRSLYWKNIVDPQTGLLSPRASNGTFTHVTPSDTTHNYVEGSAAQYRFQVPNDQPALASRLGGDSATNALLDDLFKSFNDESPTRAFLTNEFSQGQQWFYNWTHAPSHTQEVVHRWLTTTYAATCCTYPNNDDLGTMSSQYVWAAMGIYPENLGTADVTLNAPTFTQVDIHLLSGNTLTITAPQASAANYYIQSLSVNGAASTKTWLPGSLFTTGGTVAFTLGSAASTWGSALGDEPPSYDGTTGPPPAGSNVALNKPATGSASCNANEAPAKAVNGSVGGGNSDKWCSAAATKFLQVDLGATTAITSFTVRHAQSGGEQAAYNTRDFDLQVSADGVNFTTVVQARGNTAAVTSHPVTTSGRYVRLNVIAGDQTAGTVARIYELEVNA
ncbi:MAG: hypothetical protein QOI35_3127 [Cryptosporangiaceae bacterium]|nr:hypothetical protein [Cryptosporangiaceae bacterium]